ncbi:AraC family transcriptional regulator [bacterium]|nr:AraC family transcriptional regulator [bacterium]
MENPTNRLRKEYASRMNRVLDFIEIHLDQPMSLKRLSEVAHFSPYHFHRLFSAFMGETLNQFITRVRMEKAASLLVMNPQKSITEIALDCGFSGSSVFSRTFRETFKMTPTAWRNGGCETYRKNCITNRNDRQSNRNPKQALDVSSVYIGTITQTQKWRIQMKHPAKLQAEVEVRQIPDMTVAYIRHIGPYQGDEILFEKLFARLMTWAGPRDLIGPDTQHITIYHDNPEITDDDKLRISCCITVPKDTMVDGDIGRMIIEGGKYAVAHFEIFPHQYGEAWNAIYGGWLPESGYQPDDRPCFELCAGDPKKHPEGKHVVDIHIPVKPL